MEVFLASIVVFALAVLGLSLGPIFGRRPFKGQCGSERGCGHCREEPKQQCQRPQTQGREQGHT